METNAERLARYTQSLEDVISHTKGGTVHVVYVSTLKQQPTREWLLAIVNRDGIAVPYRYKAYEGRWESAGNKRRPIEDIRPRIPWDGSKDTYPDYMTTAEWHAESDRRWALSDMEV